MKRMRLEVKLFALMLSATLLFMSNGFAAEKGQAKYVFFFIGDGMGMPQRAAAAAFAQKKLAIDSMPVQGITTTYASNQFITDSAAAGTALAAGCKTNVGYIGVKPDFTPVKTVAEVAKEQGKKVGIISTVSLDHATPAAFYAHEKSRNMYHEIDCDLAVSDFDFFAGGGLKDPTGKKSKAPRGDALEMIKNHGYRIVDNKNDFMALTPQDGKIIAINANLPDGKAMPYSIDMTADDITLPEMTAKAIEMLDNPNGFFIMLESGKIDWACHANDATASLLDLLAFDDAVKVALDFYTKHPEETLIIVTGDHETGGMTLGFAGTKYASYFDVLGKQQQSFQKFTDVDLEKFKAEKGSFADMKKMITAKFGLKFSGDPEKDPAVLKDFEIAEIRQAFARSMGEKPEAGNSSAYGDFDNKDFSYLIYGGYDPLSVTLTHLVAQKAGMSWTTYQHTGIPVNTSAAGIGAEQFSGSYDNTDIARKVNLIMGGEELAEIKSVAMK